MVKPMDVVTRFAPSPTGLLHVGNYRTAVFSYLFARHHNGKFIVRIEDTDRERSSKEHEKNILDALDWLGLSYDELFRQSDHLERHREVLEKLVQEGKAYISKEESKQSPGTFRELVRFKNPNRVVKFSDAIRGDLEMDTSDLGDFVIAKDISEPLFHLAVAVDDWDHGVTHIIRGEDHISNTPRQILIQEAIGAPTPTYAHLPLVLSPDRSKLSKRRGAIPVTEYRSLGYLPQAVLNQMALIGWNPGTDEEVFTKEELVERFTLDQVQKGGAIFDATKLQWFNREHMLRLPREDFEHMAATFLSEETRETLTNAGRLESALAIAKERIHTFGDIADMEKAGEFSYLTGTPTIDPNTLHWSKENDPTKTPLRLKMALEALEKVQSDVWSETSVKEALWPIAEKEGKGQLLWPVRVALSGREKSPDPFFIAGILGKDETLGRIQNALKTLS